jgi:hypothetical protein
VRKEDGREKGRNCGRKEYELLDDIHGKLGT